ncbi:MAG: IclR family transcriptional regulator [Desulfarculus sp.]|nr:IclR family transcriptional regulator [Desulfarculus sp.]
MASGLQGNKTIAKTIKVLECFSFERQRLSLGELVQQTGLPRATLYRTVNPLLESGYLHLDPVDNRYSLGLKIFQLGHVAQAGFDLSGLLTRHLDHLAAQLPYTIIVGLLREDKLVYIDKRENYDGLKVGSQVGLVRPPWYGLLGQLLLAFPPEAESRHLLTTHPPEFWEGRVGVPLPEMLASLERVRTQGHAIAVDETAPGIAGVGFPIFDQRTDRAAAGLLVLVPTVQFTPEVKERCLALARECSQEISRRLGARSPRPAPPGATDVNP